MSDVHVQNPQQSPGDGGAGWVVAIIILLLVVVLGFLYFGGFIFRGPGPAQEESGNNINVEVPDRINVDFNNNEGEGN